MVERALAVGLGVLEGAGWADGAKGDGPGAGAPTGRRGGLAGGGEA